MKKTHLIRPKLLAAGLLLLGLAGATLSQAAGPAYQPIPITTGSYNHDPIVESNATPRLDVVTTATVDQGTNNGANTWFEVGYDVANPGNGLPAAGSTFTAESNPNYSFRAPPTYVGPNGILIDTVITNGTFTLTTPAAYTLLSFLGSGGNGGDIIGVKVNHQDGTFEVSAFPCPDWFGGTSNRAYTAGGRCQSPVTFTTETDTDNPRLYFRDVTLTNTTSPVTSVVLSYVSGGSGSHNDVVAMSGATTLGGPVGPITVTGYTYDFVVEAAAAKRGRLITPIIVDGTNKWATTMTMDNDSGPTANNGFTFYEKGHDFNMINNGPVSPTNPVVIAIAQASGIPVHGSTFTNTLGDHAYTMPPDYTTNCAVVVSTNIPTATITLVTPAAYTALSFLDASGNGPNYPTAIVHHQNGNSETNSIKIVDWFDSSPPMYIPNGRVAADTAQWSQQTFATNGADRLFATDLPLADTASPVTSIDLIYTNTLTGRSVVFALSGSTGPVAPIFTQQPVGTNAYGGNPVSFSVSVIGTAPFTYQWQKGTNGVFANLSNGGDFSGVTTPTLVVNPANYSADGFDYRAIVCNGGGCVTSAVATAFLFSTLTDVTVPGDSIVFFGGALFGDGAVANAIDNTLGTKWGCNVSSPPNVGCVITPSAGATVVSGLRIYTANDTTGRDPADYKLEGSINGGGSYTLIASNSIALPDGRNTTAVPPDPLTTFVREVSFPNSNAYTSYRLTISHLKGGDTFGQMQLGELELLGYDTNLVINVLVPPTAKAFDGNSLSIVGTATGSPTPVSRWQKQISGVFTDLHDGGTISGSQTTTLTINPAHFSDAGNFRLIATNNLLAVTSGVVVVSIYDTNVDVTVPSDTIIDFGNTSTTAATPGGGIDDDVSIGFVTRGSGLNNNAGFPPFGGPVGVVVTPQVGATVVTALRIYTGPDGTPSDPADVQLEGSNNGGTTYTTILGDMALSLPDARNTVSAVPDPTQVPAQEIRFGNAQAYTSYRLTFNHVKDDNGTYFLSLGEFELLGVPGTTRPLISGTARVGGNLNITGSGGTPGSSYSVLTNGNVGAAVATWGTNATGAFDVNGNFSASLPISPTNPRLFYLIKTP
jgi:hypothetical protein